MSPAQGRRARSPFQLRDNLPRSWFQLGDVIGTSSTAVRRLGSPSQKGTSAGLLGPDLQAITDRDDETASRRYWRQACGFTASLRAVIVVTRTLIPEDVDPLATAFASWPKSRELFETYARRLAQGSLDVVVAAADSQLLGYLLIEPTSSYPPFAKAGIPEIADFNVLRSQQRSGVGTALMDEAERRVAQFSDTVGPGRWSLLRLRHRPAHVRAAWLPAGRCWCGS